ncbi:hypothetical protein G6F53_014068 [Rhizopus delemar]|nr:hypothetical protein G6F53_014068 [Rhizopus delemar]
MDVLAATPAQPTHPANPMIDKRRPPRGAAPLAGNLRPPTLPEPGVMIRRALERIARAHPAAEQTCARSWASSRISGSTPHPA